MAREETDGTCWQCGGPADPGCVYRQTLLHRAEYADGNGYPVTRGRWGKRILKVPIPRCQACEIKNYVSGFLLLSGIFIGACVGMIQFPSRGVTTILGAVVGSLPGALGLRSPADFPPLKRLRETGWEEPG